jgi:hypothetical protein
VSLLPRVGCATVYLPLIMFSSLNDASMLLTSVVSFFSFLSKLFTNRPEIMWRSALRLLHVVVRFFIVHNSVTVRIQKILIFETGPSIGIDIVTLCNSIKVKMVELKNGAKHGHDSRMLWLHCWIHPCLIFFICWSGMEGIYQQTGAG